MADQTNDDADALGGWTSFFLELEELVSEYESFQHGSILMENLSIRLETAVKALHNILPYLSHTVQASISEIAHNMQLMFWDCQRCCEFPGRSRCSQAAVLSVSIPKTVATGRPGRPKFNIREETLIELRSLGYSWEEIAQMLLVSRWTLQRRVSEFGLHCISRFSEISDDELDSKVREFVNEHGCFVGSSMVCGYLKSEGLRVQRDRVRACLARIDPQTARLRWAITLTRRAYSVPGPNSLWHIDGHHSLVTWGFVIHGAIDGYSRLITFLNCSTNNKSETVTSQFRKACEIYGWPSRVRTDHGGENTGVWQLMVERRGANRGSFLAGTSTRNQRIERLWRDVFRCVAHIFYYTFQAMEESGVLDMSNPTHKFALHFVFLPRINKALCSFILAWNSHPLRTENNWSPERIWVNGMMDQRNQHLSAVADISQVEPSAGDLDWFGFDPLAPTPMDDGLPVVLVEDADIELTETVQQALNELINPLQVSNRFGIDIYMNCVNFLQSSVNQ